MDIMVHTVDFWHLPLVFYVKRCRSGGTYGLLWRLGRTQFSCPSRVLRDQWIKNLRTAVKTHGKASLLELCVLYVCKMFLNLIPNFETLTFTTPTRLGPLRPLRLLVFINPFGGKKKGRKIYHSLVAPLFELAGISSHVIGT